jgi:hypothetical protein
MTEASIRLKYYGWSAFRLVTPEGRRLFFDPLLADPLSGAPLIQPDGLAAGDLVCITSGRLTHCLDLPGLVEGRDVLVLAAPELCDFARRTHRVPAAKLRPVPPDGPAAVDGLRVQAFGLGGCGPDPPRRIGKAPGPIAEPVRALYRATPHAAPRMGFAVELADGRSVVHCGEGLDDPMPRDRAAALAARHRPGILIAGVQPNCDIGAAEAIARLTPRAVVLFQPDRPWFDLLGLRPEPIEAFRARIADADPAVAVQFPERLEEIAL